MDGVRSCEQCKHGPSFIACQMGKTGKPRSSGSLDFEFNPFKTSPTKYYLSKPNQMPCFQPRGASTSHERVGIGESILTSREERANYRKKLIAAALFFVVGAAIIYVVLWFISQ
jgi:hypothetical protein